MSTRRYLFWVTFWAVILPGVAMHCLTPLLIILGPTFFAFWFSSWGSRMRGDFHDAVWDGRIPESFFVRVLPFFLPIFYVLALGAAACVAAEKSLDAADVTLLFGLPQFFFWNLFVSLFVSLSDGDAWPVMMTHALVITSVTAVAGCAYLIRTAPRAKFIGRGLAGITGILAVFVGVLLFQYDHLRQHVVSSPHGETVVSEQVGRRSPWMSADETDLSAYEPFRKTKETWNPKSRLTEIPPPRLVISEDHPRIYAALAFYPVCASAVEAIYSDVDAAAVRKRNLLAGGTSPATFQSLLHGESDLVFMGRPSAAQMLEAEMAGKTLVITPIAREAFVFFVSRTNPVENLTQERIRGIYSKKIRWWSEVGGARSWRRILPFQRPEGSGSQTAMQRIMGDTPLAPPVREEYQESMGGIVNRVADYRNYGHSIGYSFRFYVEGMFQHDGVKLLSVDGAAPTVENIQNGTYPFIGDVVIVTAGSRNPHVGRLVEWFLSPEGQHLVEKVGYVPVMRNSEETQPVVEWEPYEEKTFFETPMREGPLEFVPEEETRVPERFPVRREIFLENEKGK